MAVGLRCLRENTAVSDQPTHGLAWSAGGGAREAGQNRPSLYFPGTAHLTAFISLREEKKNTNLKKVTHFLKY